ncbi:response regulator transcription factor [Sphingobium subterraneum]|uniref:Two-component system response regulator FixJ n=1 Tax=Sphingobium subterraneum TaxID=627688 RepID=A0A841J6Y4_9SPHN|nr:LuxR C-terminal-related transcriptional regulator [Sphingobium subterraneum]MBB6124295.1 two-component system response regulator FixJ [Sphingobium subterraneum]
MSFDTKKGDELFGRQKPIGIFESHHLTDDRPNAPAILRHSLNERLSAPLALWSPEADRLSSADRASLGLSYIYILDGNVQTRGALHALMCNRYNTVVMAYGCADEFLAQCSELDPGCVVIRDEGAPGGTASRIRALKRDGRFRCVVLANHPEISIAIEVMKAGAIDYIAQADDPVQLMMTVDEALGKVRQGLAATAALDRARSQLARLSTREREVLIGLVEGKSNKMIAIALDISPRTVEIYRAHLMEKLGTHTLSETLRIAFLAGIG